MFRLFIFNLHKLQNKLMNKKLDIEQADKSTQMQRCVKTSPMFKNIAIVNNFRLKIQKSFFVGFVKF